MELSLRAWYHALLLLFNGLPPRPPFGPLLPVKAIPLLTTAPGDLLLVSGFSGQLRYSHLVLLP